MIQGLFTPDEVSDMIHAGKKLLLAGDAGILSQLPKGDWIGGGTPYFILYPEQRVTSYEKIFACQVPDFATETRIMEYDEANIHTIFNDGPQNGYTVLIIPFGSAVSVEYALNATNFAGFATHPVCGWIAGQPLEIIMTEKSYAISGLGPNIHSDKAVAIHISLPESKYAEVHIFNPYKQGKGDSIKFDYNGMLLEDAMINGTKRNFAEYLHEIKYDMQLPLVANYSGAMINVVCCGIGEGKVQMSAPVFESLDYRIAIIDDTIIEPLLVDDKIVFSATCIGNFIQPDICAQYLKKMNGPVVFGEIAYQQIGQTTVYVTVDDVPLNIEKI